MVGTVKTHHHQEVGRDHGLRHRRGPGGLGGDALLPGHLLRRTGNCWSKTRWSRSRAAWTTRTRPRPSSSPWPSRRSLPRPAWSRWLSAWTATACRTRSSTISRASWSASRARARWRCTCSTARDPGGLRFGDGFRVDPQTSLFAELKALLGEACVCQGPTTERDRQRSGRGDGKAAAARCGYEAARPGRRGRPRSPPCGRRGVKPGHQPTGWPPSWPTCATRGDEAVAEATARFDWPEAAAGTRGAAGRPGGRLRRGRSGAARGPGDRPRQLHLLPPARTAAPTGRTWARRGRGWASAICPSSAPGCTCPAAWAPTPPP